MTGGRVFEDRVAQVCRDAGFGVDQQVVVGRRRWGPERRIDIVARYRPGLLIGIECRYQGSSGSAEEKCVATLWDMESWPDPYRGLLCIEGKGFSSHMRVFLETHPRVVALDDLADRLALLREVSG